MKLGHYSITPEALTSAALHVLDSLRLRVKGIPPLPGDSPVEIAKEALKTNAGKVLRAGSGHFRYLWVSDFAKALRGAEKVLSPSYLRGQIEHMIRCSASRGDVPSCFSSYRGFDMPYARADSLPLLIYSVWEYCRWVGDKRLCQENSGILTRLINDYERSHLKEGLLDGSLTGDWMDTILRPSSTYNNVCVLKMLLSARELGLRTLTLPEEFSQRLLSERWRVDHFTDYAGTEEPSVDAAVFSLYFDLLDVKTRGAMTLFIEKSGLTQPYPIRVSLRDHDAGLMPLLTKLTPRYHSSIWLHLGLMYLNALKRAGRDITVYKSRVDALIMRHRQILEVLDRDGEPYQTWINGTEVALTMAAGQYLELALD